MVLGVPGLRSVEAGAECDGDDPALALRVDRIDWIVLRERERGGKQRD